MILVAESIFDGTWASGGVPSEVIDFLLMHPDGMGWSWQELNATPIYVKRYCWDLIQIKLSAQQDAIKRTRGDNGGKH